MRPGITFHDGSPLTAQDVAFSLKILKDKGRGEKTCATSRRRAILHLRLLVACRRRILVPIGYHDGKQIAALFHRVPL
jgi:ABC-type transport system substrate-binding protein